MIIHAAKSDLDRQRSSILFSAFASARDTGRDKTVLSGFFHSLACQQILNPQSCLQIILTIAKHFQKWLVRLNNYARFMEGDSFPGGLCQ